MYGGPSRVQNAVTFKYSHEIDYIDQWHMYFKVFTRNLAYHSQVDFKISMYSYNVMI